MTIQKERLKEDIYEYITNTGEERACDAIDEKSCEELPGNFLLNATNGFASKFAEQLASPELVIPWMFSLIGVPGFFSGLLIPLKNTGSLLPQLFVAAKIRAFAVRKYFWSIAAAVQGLMLLLMAWSISEFQGATVGWVISGSLLVFSIASGVASIAYKDVIGKTIPKGNRGNLLALRATGGGILTIIAGAVFYWILSGAEDKFFVIWLLISAAMLWFLAALLFALITENRGATEGGRTPVGELKNGWKLLKEDVNFRRFLIARGLLLSIPLAQPFLILYAQDHIGVSLSELGLFVMITGVSNTISSPIWGRFADKSSHKLMMIGGIFATVVCGYVLLFGFLPEHYQNIYSFGPVFFLIIMAYGGARLGRKTYLVDYAPAKERPLYVSVANTSIGIVVLLSVLLSGVAAFFGNEVMIGLLIILMLLAAFVSSRLQKV